MEEKQMTVAEAIEATANLLREISVPVGLMQEIGFPINAAINNLMICIDSLKKQPEVADDGNDHAD